MLPLLRSALLLLGAASSVPAATTALLNIDLGTGSSPVMTGGAVLGGSGDIWNSITSTGDVGSHSLAATGLNWANGSGPSGVTFSISAGFHNNWNYNLPASDLMRDYVYIHTTSSQQSVTITLSGLGENITLSSIVFYANGDTSGQNAAFTIGSITRTTTTAGSVDATFSVYGDEYVRFDNVVTDNNGQLAITWTNPSGGSDWSAFNGMQILIPEPSVALLGGLGLLTLLRRRR